MSPNEAQPQSWPDGPVKTDPPFAGPGVSQKLHSRSDWVQLIPAEQWRVYEQAIEAAGAAGVDFMLGGAFGLAGYTGRWRNTKDLDFFIRPQDRDKAVDALLKAGFSDYYDQLPYDRGWIFRAVKNGAILDLIWQTPNRRSVVDDLWFEKAVAISMRGHELKLIPAEELLWIKLYIVQKDRCDWPDLVNLLTAVSPHLDWPHLLRRLGPDLDLLKGLMHLFAWLRPGQVKDLPGELRQNLGLADPPESDLRRPPEERVSLLDSRPWFAAFQPTDKPMQL